MLYYKHIALWGHVYCIIYLITWFLVINRSITQIRVWQREHKFELLETWFKANQSFDDLKIICSAYSSKYGSHNDKTMHSSEDLCSADTDQISKSWIAKHMLIKWEGILQHEDTFKLKFHTGEVLLLLSHPWSIQRSSLQSNQRHLFCVKNNKTEAK